MKNYTGILHMQILFFLVVVIVGCNTKGDSNDNLDFPEIGIPIKELNSHLIINPPSDIRLSQDEKCFVVIMENISSSSIMVVPELDVKIFQKANSGWESILNGMNYNHWKSLVPAKGGDLPNIRTMDICPVLIDFDEPNVLRVIITGTPENLFGVKNTVSFLDVTVSP